MILKVIFALLFGYLIGSVPWALICGELFFKTDVREHGSGNLGATNAGRVLGVPMFILVTLLDGAKGFVVFQILRHYDLNLALVASLGVFIGHCYPLFAHFKGGKGVACSAGVVLAVALTGDFRYFVLQFLIPLITLAMTVLISRYMSLGSILGFSMAVLMAWISNRNIYVDICLTLLWLLVIIKHHENIRRLLNHQENKVF